MLNIFDTSRVSLLPREEEPHSFWGQRGQRSGSLQDFIEKACYLTDLILLHVALLLREVLISGSKQGHYRTFVEKVCRHSLRGDMPHLEDLLFDMEIRTVNV